MPLQITKHKKGICFPAVIQPRSSRNTLAGLHNGQLKLKLTAPPVDGAANKSCINFLADLFEISPSRVAIVRGATARNKVIYFEDMDEKTFSSKLMCLLSRVKKKD